MSQVNQVFQQTLKEVVSFEGVGLHTGEKVKMNLVPEKAGFGIRFKRIDIENQPMLKADVDYVVDTSRGTTLEHSNGARVATVEHIMSALVAVGVDNVIVELDGPEVPIMDGSAYPFIEAMEKVGFEVQDAEREYFPLDKVIEYKDEETGTEFMAIPMDRYQLTTMIDFEKSVIGAQHFSLKSLEDYKSEVAKARTFVFLHELEYLYDNNLIKGGDLANAVVIVDKEVEEKTLEKLRKIFNKEDVQIKGQGVLNNVELRYDNEPVRHKTLDLIGDVALTGYHFNAHIIATKPGHKHNVAFAKELKKYVRQNRHLYDIPKYDPTEEPLYDINKIETLLPHKYPFLLVDKILSMTDTEVVGIKNVTFNEEFFQGHFPGNPVMPGVMQIEAMAQVGGILALSNYEDPENYNTYFLKIDNVRFKHKVIPGDTLIFKLKLINPIRRGICEMSAVAYVGNKVVVEADLVAQIAPK